jgi:two-component system OmpR family response regulator
MIQGSSEKSIPSILMKLLLIEDNNQIAAPLAEALTDQHYAVDLAEDGQTGWELIEAFTYDLIILDVMLPKLNGVTLCHKLRQAKYTIPVLMLTAKDTSIDKVLGLDAGADDYVVKPFDLQELLARVRALLRRNQPVASPVLSWNELSLNPATCEVEYAGQPIALTPKEYGLLELLLRHNGRVLSREMILNHLWSSLDVPGQETVKVHLRGLRQKLKAAGAASDFVETVYGLGYRLK